MKTENDETKFPKLSPDASFRYSTIQLHNPPRTILLADEREVARIEFCSVWGDEDDEAIAKLLLASLASSDARAALKKAGAL